MSWIQENKFVAGVAGVTAVVAGAIFVFGNSKGSSHDDSMKKYKAATSRLNSLERANPYPNEQNRAAREKSVNEYEGIINDVRGTLSGFGPKELPKLSPEQFGDERTKVHTDLTKAFTDAKTELDPDCYFGFEKYSASLPQAKATSHLGYQLNAVNWLLSQLAAHKPSALINVHRELIAAEKGETTPPPTRRRPNNRQRKPKTVEKAYELMPMELTFTADEKNVRDFLKAMVNSKEYFYSIRAVRIRNEKQKPPSVTDVSFQDEAAAPDRAAEEDNPFGGLALPDDEENDEQDGDEPAPAPEPPKPAVSNERILEQVLGKEKIHVHICFDVVLVKPIKTDKTNSEKPAGN